MNTKVIFWGVLIAVLVGIGVFTVRALNKKSKAPAISVTETKRVKVVTTLFPWYDMVRTLGGDRVDVTLVLPPGMEPHDFEPTPSDLVAIDASDVFMYTGESLELWASDISKNAAPQTIVIDASEGINLLPNIIPNSEEPDQKFDPHFWLNPEYSMQVAKRVAAILSDRDPAGTELFQKNLAAYTQEMRVFDDLYRKTLSGCQTKLFVYGGHFAFEYVAERYGLKYQSAQGLSPESEPSAQDIARLIDQIRREHVQALFSEELASSKVAETLAQETGAEIFVINPAENVTKEEFDNGITLEHILGENLRALERGLNCPSLADGLEQ
jgi:zinc transport system substrate-binding protein